LSATLWLAQEAIKGAVFTENSPLSMTIRTLHRMQARTRHQRSQALYEFQRVGVGFGIRRRHRGLTSSDSNE
jgi:hypothetical protein